MKLRDVFSIVCDSDLTHREVRVWLGYRYFDHRDCGTFVSDGRLAEELGMSERAVQSTRQRLIRKGYLQQTLRGPETALRRAILPGEGSQKPARQDSQKATKHDDDVSQVVSQVVSQKPADRIQTIQRNTPNPSHTPPGGSEWDAFAEGYPERSGEQDWAKAKRRWIENTKAGVSASDMLAGVKRYAALCKAEGKVGTRFVKMAANWLDPAARRWKEPFHITECTKSRDGNGPPASVRGGPPNWVLSDREIAEAARTGTTSDVHAGNVHA